MPTVWYRMISDPRTVMWMNKPHKIGSSVLHCTLLFTCALNDRTAMWPANLSTYMHCPKPLHSHQKVIDLWRQVNANNRNKISVGQKEQRSSLFIVNRIDTTKYMLTLTHRFLGKRSDEWINVRWVLQKLTSCTNKGACCSDIVECHCMLCALRLLQLCHPV